MTHTRLLGVVVAEKFLLEYLDGGGDGDAD